MNLIKTQAMVIGSRPSLKKISDNLVPTPSFAIGNSHIDVVANAKYLGIQLDKHLMWDEHTKALHSKIPRSLGFLKYAKKLLPKHTLSQIYRGIVEPHFHYRCSVWGNCRDSRLSMLQKLQNRTARIATNSSYEAPPANLIGEMADSPRHDQTRDGYHCF